jgi:hypothetical protein
LGRCYFTDAHVSGLNSDRQLTIYRNGGKKESEEHQRPPEKRKKRSDTEELEARSSDASIAGQTACLHRPWSLDLRLMYEPSF